MVEQNNDQNGDQKEMVSKEEYEALKSKSDKLEKDLEDVRMEVLTPEYTSFLEAQEKGAGKGKEKEKEQAGDDDWEKLSKKEIFERAKKAALDEVNATLDKQRQETKKEADSRTQREISTFAATHEDFQTYRPIMYGLSLDPKYADLSLEALYTKSKEHVKKLAGTTDEEKERQRKTKTEKPSGDNQSFEKIKKMSNESIARETLDEIKKELGPIPAA